MNIFPEVIRTNFKRQSPRSNSEVEKLCAGLRCPITICWWSQRGFQYGRSRFTILDQLFYCGPWAVTKRFTDLLYTVLVCFFVLLCVTFILLGFLSYIVAERSREATICKDVYWSSLCKIKFQDSRGNQTAGFSLSDFLFTQRKLSGCFNPSSNEKSQLYNNHREPSSWLGYVIIILSQKEF